MSVVEFKRKKTWDASNCYDCLEITKQAMQNKGEPESILIIPISSDGVAFFIGGKEMSSIEVIGVLELVKNDILLGGLEDEE